MKYYEIKNNPCEICGEESQVAINDSEMNLRYACLVHVDDLYHKLNKQWITMMMRIKKIDSDTAEEDSPEEDKEVSK